VNTKKIETALALRHIQGRVTYEEEDQGNESEHKRHQHGSPVAALIRDDVHKSNLRNLLPKKWIKIVYSFVATL
jgi:hypothetical protein